MQASRARRKEREFELKEIWKKYIHSESENQEWQCPGGLMIFDLKKKIEQTNYFIIYAD